MLCYGYYDESKVIINVLILCILVRTCRRVRATTIQTDETSFAFIGVALRERTSF